MSEIRIVQPISRADKKRLLAFPWDIYKDDLISIFKIRQGGLAIYGGVLYLRK